MSIIRPIPHLVGEHLRSQSESSTFAQCVCLVVENAIDAQATRIDITVDSSSLSFTCHDNGTGLSRDDLTIIGLSYHSSRVSDLNDISSTYGFKGSSLYNISNISLTTITSKQQGSSDTFRTRIYHGKRIILGRHIEDDMEPGTRVDVYNLFAKQPVRKEYFKSKQNWTNQIFKLKHSLSIICISCPNIQIKLQIDDDNAIRIPFLTTNEFPRKLQILENIYKSKISSHTAVTKSFDDINISGYIYTLSSGTIDRTILLNRRLLGSKSLYQRINKLLDHNSYLFQIDFNQSVSDLFENASFDIFDSERLPIIEELLLSIAIEFNDQKTGKSIVKAQNSGKNQLPKSLEYLQFEKIPSLQTKATGARETLSKYFSQTFKLVSEDLLNARIIAQVDEKFIMIRNGENIILVDQHAADERIRLETNLEQFLTGDINPVQLTSSAIFTMSNEYMEFVKNLQYQFSKWGIIYSINDTNQIELTAIPEILRLKIRQKDFMKTLISRHINNINAKTSMTDDTINVLPDMLVDVLKSNACRSAIMFGDKLTISECKDLIENLAKCEFPFSCAHGRPSAIPVASLS